MILGWAPRVIMRLRFDAVVRPPVLAMLFAAGCGVRVPPAIDTATLVAARGPRDAHRDLVLRVRATPNDVQLRLALAALAEQLGRPAEAIDNLVAVDRLGGPLGTRWHDTDRARLARLLLRRGRVRLARGSSQALADLSRAHELGAPVSPAELAEGRAAAALSALRHVDAEERAKGRAMFMSLVAEHGTYHPERASEGGRGPVAFDPSWTGARADAAPAERGAFGRWAWQHGARREAYDQLTAWRTTTSSPRDAQYESYYQCARAWWSPPLLSAPRSSPEHLIPAQAVAGERSASAPGQVSEIRIFDCAAAGDFPPVPVRSATPIVEVPSSADPHSSATRVPVYVAQSPRAEASARYAYIRAIAIVAGGQEGGVPQLSREQINAAGIPQAAELVEIARAFRSAPADAARLADDLVARSVDAVLGHATVGALFDAVGDRVRARAEWQAAASASDEPAIVAGFAEACARAGDGDAALVAATSAAAASGDPAVVWHAVTQALLDGNRIIEALTAARAAIDLAGSDTIAAALDVAIEASQLAGRAAQVTALRAQRARVMTDDHGDLTREKSMAKRAPGTTGEPEAIDRAWAATRQNPREVDLRARLLKTLAIDDPRRAVIVTELVELAADRDHLRGLHAAFALP